MKYITGIHALNLVCQLDTPGDWHQSALRWKDITYSDTSEGVFGEYGIEENHTIPEHEGVFCAANHIRALLDLIYMRKFSVAQGMKESFISDDKYTPEIFDHVYLLRNLSYWEEINDFMKKEYRVEWINFIKNQISVTGDQNINQ